jgi:hypothetical protein
LGWTLTAVITFSAVWLLIPIIAAWATHTERLDPALERMGRPVGRMVDWLECHPRTILAVVALMAILYPAAAWMALRDGRHFMGVLVIFNGIAFCMSLLTTQRTLRESTRARRESPGQGSPRRTERRGR